MWNIWRRIRRLGLPGREWNGWPKVALAVGSFIGVAAWLTDWRFVGLISLVIVCLAAMEVTS